MKNVIKTVFLILFCLIIGCGEDDGNVNQDTFQSYIKVDGTVYELSQGYLENYGEWGDSFNFDLTLLSSGLDVTIANGEIAGATGTGHGIYFEIVTSNANKLAVGDYEYSDSNSPTPEVFTFAEGGINSNAITGESELEFSLTDGTLSIIENSGAYEISFLSEDESVEIYYQGKLDYLDYRETGKLTKPIKIKSFVRCRADNLATL